jgi:hypothetical protein
MKPDILFKSIAVIQLSDGLRTATEVERVWLQAYSDANCGMVTNRAPTQYLHGRTSMYLTFLFSRLERN